MALATFSDVRRVLGRDNVPDTQIQPFLAAVEEWLKKYTGRDFGATGTVTEKFYNVREGSILYLSDISPGNVSVTVFASANGTGDALQENKEFQVLSHGRVQLFPFALRAVPGLEGVVVRALPRFLARVEVTYTASGQVPSPVREAVALGTAARILRSRPDAQGFQSERLGDYSYSRGTGDLMPDSVRSMLRPYRRRRSVSV